MPKSSAVRFNVPNSKNLKPAVSLKTRANGPRNARNDDHKRDEEVAQLAAIFQFIRAGAFDQTMSQGAEHNGNQHSNEVFHCEKPHDRGRHDTGRAQHAGPTLHKIERQPKEQLNVQADHRK